MAHAQAFSGAPLQPVVNARGPFKQVVVGASVVAPNATVIANVDGDVNIPDGSLPVFGGLFWWGSTANALPDRSITITLPDGSAFTFNADDPTPADPGGVGADNDDPCFTVDTAAGVVSNATAAASANGFQFFSCFLEITPELAGQPTLDGTYALAGLAPNVAAPHNSPCGGTGGLAGSQACSVYAGGFSLAILYVDPNDASPRVVQIASGMVFNQQFGNDASAPMLPFEMSNNGGSATIVALEGDVEFPQAGQCNGTIDDVDAQQRPECDFFVFCRGTCISNPSVLQLTSSDVIASLSSGANPIGNIFNETVSTEFGAEVSGVNGNELNSLDIDTFNLQGKLPNGFYDDLVIGLQSGGDAVLLTLVAVSIEDFDADADGLSNLQEDINGDFVVDANETNPNNFDSDGDGVGDGAEVFGGNPADPLSNPTDPLDPDSDDDGLCDGSGTIAAVCTGGEDLNNDGLRQANETNANDGDSDDDLLNDGLEVLGGNYLGCADASCIDANAGLAGFQTNPLVADTDGDGLEDGVEDLGRDGLFDPANNETDPTNPDTDFGGEADGSERVNGRDPVDFPEDDNGALEDTDQDGLPNGVEPTIGTDPFNPDTDADGLLDGVEVNGTNDTDPLDSDTDDDGILDGTEDLSQDGVTQDGELSPVDTDSDDDGLLDGVEDGNFNGTVDAGETDGTDADTDGDGLCDGNIAVGACIDGEDSDLDGDVDAGAETDPLNPDTDGDGVDDGTEVTSDYGGPVDANPDRDGSQTDPLNPDTDGDGLSDGAEDLDGNGRFEPGNGESNPTDFDDPNPAGEGEGEGEGEGDDGDINGGDGNGINDDVDVPDIEEPRFISGSALYACSHVDGAGEGGAGGAPIAALAIALLGAIVGGRRRRR